MAVVLARQSDTVVTFLIELEGMLGAFGVFTYRLILRTYKGGGKSSP